MRSPLSWGDLFNQVSEWAGYEVPPIVGGPIQLGVRVRLVVRSPLSWGDLFNQVSE